MCDYNTCINWLLFHNSDLILEMNSWSVIFSKSSENQIIGTIMSLRPSAAGTPSILLILILTCDRIFPLNPLPSFYKLRQKFDWLRRNWFPVVLSYWLHINVELMFVLVRFHSFDSISKTLISLEKMRPREQCWRPILTSANIKHSWRSVANAIWVITKASIVRIFLGCSK